VVAGQGVGSGQGFGSDKAVGPLAPGFVVAERFRLEEVIGSGGMGVVFRATVLETAEAVAIKFVNRERLVRSSSERSVTSRLLREASRAAQIQHPHVVRVFEWGTVDDTPFLVMELLQGQSFRQLLNEHGPLPIDTVCRLMGEVCLGLREAHRLGIVHRDLTPNNLFECRTEGRKRAKVLDFGLAKSLTQDGEYETTVGQAVLGSPAYMAPEQIRHPDRIDLRSDIWSLAVVTQELLCGRVPFAGRTHGDTLARVLSDIPEPLPADLPVAEPLRIAITRCLRKDPRERLTHVDHFLAALSTRGARPPRAEPSPESTLTETHGHSPWRQSPPRGTSRDK
jgi:eukaryotic-like serine/threonine-protein kinase